MIKPAQLGFAAAKNFGKKHFATAVKATKELKAKVKIPNTSQIKSFGSKVEKHIKRHPIKYTAGATAVASYGIFKEHKKMKPNLIKAFGALPPGDARYKALKQGGYITKKQHRKNLLLWKDAGFPRV